MEPVTHIIGRQKIKLRYHGTTNTLALRQMMSNVCNDELPARLNKLLDRYDDKDFVLRIDKLEVRLKLSDDGNLQEKLADAIIEKVEAQLRQRLEQRIDKALSVDKSFAGALRFYLEKGHLPWWSVIEDEPALQHALDEAWAASRLKHIISEVLPYLTSAHVRVRFVNLLNVARFEAFVLAAMSWQAEEWSILKESIRVLRKRMGVQSKGIFTEHFFRLILLEAISRTPSPAAMTKTIVSLLLSGLRKEGLSPEQNDVIQMLQQLNLNADDVKVLKQEEIKDTPIPAVEEADSVLINNAGLVLLASYLPALFRNLGLMDGKHLTDPSRAIAMLRYLVYEHCVYEEFEVVLDKILCGLPLAESIERKYRTTPEEQEEAGALLESVIEHWTVLKNTSPGGLRHNFLQREGKLVFQNGQWELTVQREAQDLLLDYLPWNISMIKLPWMQHMLTVRWNT